MLLLRVMLPDRPGSLGQVATAMGLCGADISAVEVVEKQNDFAVNDFMLTMPPGALADTLVSECNAIDGVRVLWLSSYPENWGLESDIETLNHMTGDPEHAAEVLAEAAPTVFHAAWSLLLDEQSRVLTSTDMAPEFGTSAVTVFGDPHEVHGLELPAGWQPGWTDATCAVAPIARGGAIVVGRIGGPVFLDSELSRLRHLAGLAR